MKDSFGHTKGFRVFEYPLNERIRLLLRLENIFNQLSYYSSSDGIWDSWAAVSALINLQNLVELSDIKSEVLRELERQNQHLSELSHSPQIDATKLSDIIASLSGHVKALIGTSGRIGQELRNNDFLSTIRQRLTIPGGTCNFDAPAYNYWLSLPVETRKTNLNDWTEGFSGLRAAIFLILDLIRNNITRSEEITTIKNFFSTSLDSLAQPYQLVQVVLTTQARIFPEISGGRQRVSIRFLSMDSSQRTIQVQHDVRFLFRCCS